VRVSDPHVATALQGLDLLFLDAGAWDEYHLQLGARRLVHQLQALDIAHEYDEFPGGHRGTTWRYDVSLPKLARALTR
jgi:enterochelin esterase family protein